MNEKCENYGYYGNNESATQCKTVLELKDRDG